MSTASSLEAGQAHKILWLTDLSARAAACEHAVRWFATLATQDGDDPATVFVAHALGADAGEPAERTEQRRVDAKAQLAALAGDLGSVGIDAHPIVVRGKPWEVSKTLVDEHGIDLCVVGRTGVGALDRMLLGSTARRVVRELRVPVMVVHHGDFPSPRNFVCPVDPTDVKAAQASDCGIRVAASLARAAGGRVVFVSVALVTGFVPEDRLDVGRRLEQKVRGVLGEGLEGLDHGFRVVQSREVAQGVAEASHKADLLVLGSAGRTGLARMVLGSVAEDLVEHCPANTLVVH